MTDNDGLTDSDPTPGVIADPGALGIGTDDGPTSGSSSGGSGCFIDSL